MILPETTGDATTRSLNDQSVQELRVFVFDKNGDYVYDAAGNSITQSGNNLSCRILMYEGTYSFVVIANAASWITASFPNRIIPENTDYERFSELLVAECSDIWSAVNPLTDFIPMWGIAKNQSISLTSDNVSGIQLLRALAGIDIKVENSVPGVYELKSVTVYRNYRRGRIIPEENNWNGVKVVAPSLPVGGSLINSTGKTITNITNSGKECTGEIYIFETPAGTDLSEESVDENFCLVLGMLYNGSTSYYRVDFVGNLGYIPVLRNQNYLLTVKDIEREGAGSVAEALLSRPANITYDITDTNKTGMNHIAWDGQHYLMVSSDSLHFWNQTSELTLRVQTNYQGGWTIDNTTLPSWIDIQPNSSTNTTEDAVKVKVLMEASLTDERETMFTVQAAGLSLNVKVVQSHLIELRIDTDVATSYSTPTTKPPQR